MADAALAERCVTVVPDILANAGGVLTSYFDALAVGRVAEAAELRGIG